MVSIDNDYFLNWAAQNIGNDQGFQKWANSVGGVNVYNKDQFVIVIKAFMDSMWSKDFNKTVLKSIQKEANAQREHQLALADKQREQMELEIKLEKARLEREKQDLERHQWTLKHDLDLRKLLMESESHHQQFMTRQMQHELDTRQMQHELDTRQMQHELDIAKHREIMADKEIRWFKLNNTMDVDEVFTTTDNDDSSND